MIYISSEYFISAISQLAHVHTFLGITFLTCKKEQLPVGTPISFQMDSNTKAFMNSSIKYAQRPTTFFNRIRLCAVNNG